MIPLLFLLFLFSINTSAVQIWIDPMTDTPNNQWTIRNNHNVEAPVNDSKCPHPNNNQIHYSLCWKICGTGTYIERLSSTIGFGTLSLQFNINTDIVGAVQPATTNICKFMYYSPNNDAWRNIVDGVFQHPSSMFGGMISLSRELYNIPNTSIRLRSLNADGCCYIANISLNGEPLPPSKSPTTIPTPSPTDNPTPAPTDDPITSPTNNPITSPTDNPTPAPTDNPTPAPTDDPIPSPTNNPITWIPTINPILVPTISPQPVLFVSDRSSDAPTESPMTIAPTMDNNSGDSGGFNQQSSDTSIQTGIIICAVIVGILFVVLSIVLFYFYKVKRKSFNIKNKGTDKTDIMDGIQQNIYLHSTEMGIMGANNINNVNDIDTNSDINRDRVFSGMYDNDDEKAEELNDSDDDVLFGVITPQ